MARPVTVDIGVISPVRWMEVGFVEVAEEW